MEGEDEAKAGFLQFTRYAKLDAPAHLLMLTVRPSGAFPQQTFEQQYHQHAATEWSPYLPNEAPSASMQRTVYMQRSASHGSLTNVQVPLMS